MVCHPEDLGGLGVLDLENFGRALRIRWPWNQWTGPERPWEGSELLCNDKDMALFWAATTVTIGNGMKTSFWFDMWLHALAPKDIVPSIFALANHKRETIFRELRDHHWIRSVHAISTTKQIRQFVDLWS